MTQSSARTSWSLGLLLVGCTVQTTEGSVDVVTQAIGACGETVPADRNVDGVPAYKQCAAAENSAIYSNNGVDTSTTSMGSGWVRTQYSGGYQCTELAGRYLHFKWDVSWRPDGNAGQWCDSTPPASSGLVQTMAPTHGDVMVLAPGSCGADASTGHVTVVDLVDAASGKLTVVEQNGARRGTYMQSCAKCFLHVVENDGTNPGNMITGSAVAQPEAAGAAAPGTAAGAPASGSAGGLAPTPGRSIAGAGAPTPRPAPGAQGPSARVPAAAGSPAPTPAPTPAPAPALATTPPPTTQPGAATTVNAEPASRTPAAEAGGCSVAAWGTTPAWPTLAALSCMLGILLVRTRSRRRQSR